MSFFGSRLKQFRKQTGLNQTEFGEKIKANQQSVSQWEKGEHVPAGENLLNIQKAFPALNIDWLVYGSGNMLKKVEFTGMRVEKVESESDDKELREAMKENQALRARVTNLEERIQFLTDKLLQLNEEYTELLKNKNK